MSTQLNIVIWSILLLHKTKSQQFIDCQTMECKRSYIICVDDEDCHIDCSVAEGACQSSIVICPANGNCHIQCDSNRACNKMTIYAQKSNTLALSCESHLESCYFMDVYCPQNKGDKTCTISGYNDFFEMAVYAFNGFNDVYFDIFVSLPATSIHCSSSSTNSTFDTSCVVSPTFPHTKCINDDTACYPDGPSTSPTNMATNIPTVSTLNPSHIPSISPNVVASTSQSVSPSFTATIFPTSNPSQSPTLNPIPVLSSTTQSPTVSLDTTLTTSTPMTAVYETTAMELTSISTRISSIVPTTTPSQTPTAHITTRRPVVTRHRGLMTSTAASDIILETVEYKNDTNGDGNSEKMKPITIDLENLLYVVLGIVFTCCVVCGFCFVKNNLCSGQSDEESENETKWSDWNGNNHEFIFRTDLNSASSDLESPSSKMPVGNVDHEKVLEVKEEEEDMDYDGLPPTLQTMDDKKTPESEYGSETNDELSNIIKYVSRQTKNYGAGLGESVPTQMSMPMERYDTQYTQTDDCKHSEDAHEEIVSNDEFCMKLVDYILDDKTLNNNIISDMIRDSVTHTHE